MRYLEIKKARIEIIPMIDIMFFLLVFFILISLRMIPGSGMSTLLPHSSTTEQLPHPKIVLTLRADGVVMLEGAPIALDVLTAKLRSGAAAKTVVTLAGEKSVSLQQLTLVMDACRKAGVVQIGLAMRDAQ